MIYYEKLQIKELNGKDKISVLKIVRIELGSKPWGKTDTMKKTKKTLKKKNKYNQMEHLEICFRNIVTDVKNLVDRLNSWFDPPEDRTNTLENRSN